MAVQLSKPYSLFHAFFGSYHFLRQVLSPEALFQLEYLIVLKLIFIQFNAYYKKCLSGAVSDKLMTTLESFDLP